MRWVLLLLLLLFVSIVSSQLGALPKGCFTSTPDLNIKIGTSVVYCSSMTICSTNGTWFSFQGVWRNAPSPVALSLVVTFTGQAVCSTSDNALIITLTPNSCSQAGLSFPPFCSATTDLYAGEFKYGVSSAGSGLLIIDRWSGALYPIEFICSSNNTCDMSLACNSTTIFQPITNVYGGNVTVDNSYVQLAPNASAVFTGETITLVNNNDITLQQSNSINETTVWIIGMPMWCYLLEDGTEYCLV
jgi:hypothetical protein